LETSFPSSSDHDCDGIVGKSAEFNRPADLFERSMTRASAPPMTDKFLNVQPTALLAEIHRYLDALDAETWMSVASTVCTVDRSDTSLNHLQILAMSKLKVIMSSVEEVCNHHSPLFLHLPLV
jgi:hypothetical protein